MKVIITIDTESDAFNASEEQEHREVARILLMLAARCSETLFLSNLDGLTLRDENRKPCGQVRIEQVAS